jgi:hypothetical protein
LSIVPMGAAAALVVSNGPATGHVSTRLEESASAIGCPIAAAAVTIDLFEDYFLMKILAANICPSLPRRAATLAPGQ